MLCFGHFHHQCIQDKNLFLQIYTQIENQKLIATSLDCTL